MIKPTWIKKKDEDAAALADCLATYFQQATGSTKREINDETARILEGCPVNIQVAKGLLKLMWDRCRFQEPASDDLIVERERVFDNANALMARGDWASLSDYRAAVAGAQDSDPETLDARIYSDLEMYQPLIEVRPVDGAKLISRYNAALVQSLLLHAESVVIHVPAKELTVLRNLFRHLKFHQLMVDVAHDGDGYRLTLDGPLSLFQQTKRYGMNLARFFPVLLHEKRWQLTAEIRYRGKPPGTLVVDQTQPLTPYTKASGGYIPPEFELLCQAVGEQLPGWRAEAGERAVQLPNGDYVFPDFALHHGDQTLYLELFHRWHRGALRNRLAAGLNPATPLLVLGVDTALSRDKTLAAELDAHAYFQEYGFTFRDIPTVTKLKSILKRWGARAH